MKHIYQLKITLKVSEPTIWRRIQVYEDISFSDLHDVIQITMGWDNDHQYEFSHGTVRIFDFQGFVDDGSNPSEMDSMEACLNEIVSMVKSKINYVYDFGDSWEHEILLEKVLPEEEGKIYPVCLEGERACPPEDIGGIWRFQEVLKILKDESHPEYEEIIDWVGEDWDADFFDLDETNDVLKDYQEQWDEIYDQAEETLENLENGVFMEDEDADYVDDFEIQRKFNSPQDMLKDPEQGAMIRKWYKNELEESKSIEAETFERLQNLGFEEKRIEPLMLEALSIEWYYDFMYATDHLEERYAYNLKNLPNDPQEIPRLEDALEVIDRCKQGVPFLAIEYLQKDDSQECTDAIITALKNHSDHQYCWGDCTHAPFWYALAAQDHICEALIDPVIQLYEENDNDSDWLSAQGQLLIGKLAQKYPDLTVNKVLEAMEADAKNATKPFIFYLFDALYFCDVEKYKGRLLALLELVDLSWYEPYVQQISYLQLPEAIPVLERGLKKLKNNTHIKRIHPRFISEIEIAIDILKSGSIPDEDYVKPICLTREGTWQDELREDEAYFYKEEGDDDPLDSYDYPIDPPASNPFLYNPDPFIKKETPGRNDPCHCGSGKKYKKCCMDKDR